MQLQLFEQSGGPVLEYARLKELFGDWPEDLLQADLVELRANLQAHQLFIKTGERIGDGNNTNDESEADDSPGEKQTKGCYNVQEQGPLNESQLGSLAKPTYLFIPIDKRLKHARRCQANNEAEEVENRANEEHEQNETTTNIVQNE
ncbi:unnamed protein product [Protopolystoma xenopodis]|uniref:Uncharacterized protein n=1 Tax=Protopolystoma xenopodis TaxID=117903 RepID=A0A3S5C0C0_9PLAT|nr:unnamed protein product [Protopolystoma xenopodis]